MIIFIFIDLNELQKKGRNYVWTRPKKCFVCGRFQVWGHGFVDCLFDGFETALPCKRLGAEPKGEKEGGQGEVWAEMEDPVFRNGLMELTGHHPVDRRRFEAEFPNDLWQSDVMHGPQVEHEGKLRKAYLIAIIDDHSRLIPYARFYLTETLFNTASLPSGTGLLDRG